MGEVTSGNARVQVGEVRGRKTTKQADGVTGNAMRVRRACGCGCRVTAGGRGLRRATRRLGEVAEAACECSQRGHNYRDCAAGGKDEVEEEEDDDDVRRRGFA